MVASGLKYPFYSVVTEDGQHIVVAELEGDRMTILTTSRQVVRQFGSRGQGPAKFANPYSVYSCTRPVTTSLWLTLIHSIQNSCSLGHMLQQSLKVCVNLHFIQVDNCSQ